MKFKENAIKPGMVIHCPKEEDARALLEHLDGLAYTWGSEEPLSENRKYDYRIYTCYHLCGDLTVLRGRIDDYVGNRNITITEFSDLIEPDENLANKANDLANSLDNQDNDLDNQRDNEMTAVEVLNWFGDNAFDSEVMVKTFMRDTSIRSIIRDFGAQGVIDCITAYEAAKKKKPAELEWVNVVKIIDDDTGECVQRIELIDGERKVPTERALKEYRTHHEGNYYAVVERRCRVKGE